MSTLTRSAHTAVGYLGFVASNQKGKSMGLRTDRRAVAGAALTQLVRPHVLLFLLLLLLTATGCGAPQPATGGAAPPPEGSRDEPQLVTFLTSGDPAERDAYQTLVTSFNDSHP